MTSYVWALSQEEQVEIMHRLILAGIDGEDLERAMDGRVCDLADTIDVTDWR